jgi:hypothetical protein
MTDLIFLATGIGFFVVTVGLVYGFERLRGNKS